MSIKSSQERLLVAALCAAFFLPVAAGTILPQGDPTKPKGTPDLSSGIRSYGPGADRQIWPAVEASHPPSPSQRAIAGGSKISGAGIVGSVTAFALTPDGATAVYIADQDTLGLFELYSTPVNGTSAPIKISTGLAFGVNDEGVALFRISPDGTQVAFLADADLGTGSNDAYSAPVNGMMNAVRLSTAAQAPVSAIGIGLTGTAAFFGSGSGAVEAYRATLGTPGSGVRLSDAGASNPNGNVVFADFSPDGATLLYAADATADNVFQFHSVPINAAGPGNDTQLSNALGSVGLGAIAPDNATAVYTADQNLLGVADLYSVSLSGGASVKLTPSIAGSGVTAFVFRSNVARVAYLADQVTAGVVEVFSAQLGSAGSGTRLNTPLSGTQFANVLTIAPDGTVLYEADENTVGTFDLLSVPIDGSATPTTLHGMTPPDTAGSFVGLGTPVVGKRAIYPVFGSSVELYSVPFDGSAGFTRINAVGENVRDAFVPSGATRLTAYGVGAGIITEDLFAAAIRGDLPTEQLNLSAPALSLGVLAYEIAASEAYGVFLQDQDTPGKPELYSTALDSDQDTVGNATDNCPFVSNIGQGPVVFGPTVQALDKTTLSWGVAQDVRFVRGSLASVASLSVDQSGTLVEATSHVDADVPGSGSGFFYLFAVDCDGRSYQTAIGAEPGRDIAGLP